MNQRRLNSLAAAIALSGAIIGWGDDLEHAFDLVIFLSLPHDLRVSRLRARELARYGRINEPFIAWAAGERRLKILVGVDDSAACEGAIQFVKAMRAFGAIDIDAQLLSNFRPRPVGILMT